MMKTKILLTLLLLSLNIFAHEYWFEPEKSRLAPGEKTAVHLYVGEGLSKEEERPVQLAMTPEFNLFSLKKEEDLKHKLIDGTLPIYNFSAPAEGNYLLALHRNWSYIKIEPKKFEDYLRDEGMDYIIAERDKLGEREKEGRERYSRYLKSLFQVGSRRDASYAKRVGQKLEILPLENPYSKKSGDTLKFQILFMGKPLAGYAVFADNRSNAASQKMTTDKEGKVMMKVDRTGFWMVRLVFMQRCREDCREADWESYWGALTFGL